MASFMLSDANAAARLAGLLDSAMDAIITVDEAQRIVLYNHAAERIFGWPAAEMRGQPLSRLLPERFRSAHAAHLRRFGATGTSTRRMGGSTERIFGFTALQVMGRPPGMLIPKRFRGSHRDQVRRFGATGVTNRRMGDRGVLMGLRASGEEFPIDASISQVDTPEGKLFTVILRDVTERVRSQDELLAFAAEATEAREEEKARVARELHDELAQALAKIDARWVLENLGDRPRLAEKLEAMVQMLDEAVAATRRIAADLRPLILDDLGLVPALQWLAGTFTERHAVQCRLEVDESLELQEPHATTVFRIVQECLANVAKHAQARNVHVRVLRGDGDIVLSVQDDGVGLDVGQAPRPASLGIAGLRQRAKLLHGSLVLTSEPGRGTRVEAAIPLDAAG